MEAIANSPEPEIGQPKPGSGAPNPPAPRLEPLRDRTIRAILIPMFGIVIPHLSGYFGSVKPGSALYWGGLTWAILISFVIWHGNRFFLIEQRRHFDWFDHPVRKLALLLFANVFYTAPVTAAMMLGWYRMAGFGPDWDVIRVAALACVICVIFITHVYETVYLIQQREGDMLAVERLSRARAQAELDALKAQVDPHFLFNSLNTLSWLIQHSPAAALRFNENLADVYRYILVARSCDLVPLEEELEFLGHYFQLLRLRFEDGIRMETAVDPAAAKQSFVPPISLQLLVENAVKHNEISRENPLHLEVKLEDGAVAVGHGKRPRQGRRGHGGVGLANLDERCRLVLGGGIEIVEDERRFLVRVPVKVA